MTTRIASSETAVPAAAIRSPGRRLPARERVPEAQRRHREPDLLLREHGEQRRQTRTRRAGPRRGTRRRTAGAGRRARRRGSRPERATARADRAGRRARSRAPRAASRGACAPARRPAARRARRPAAWTTRSSEGSGQSNQSGANAARRTSVCAAEARDLLAPEVGHPQGVSVGGRPDDLGHVPEVETPCVERLVTEHGERGEARGERADRCPEGRLDPHSASRSPRQRAPSTSSLACSR